MALCIALFGVIWAFAPEKLTIEILLQFMFAIPLLYISSIAYTKIAYYTQNKLWENLGWFTGTTGTAFVLNIIAIFMFLIGHPLVALFYFILIWVLLLSYTIINIYYDPRSIRMRIFRLCFFISVQLVFGIGVIYF